MWGLQAPPRRVACGEGRPWRPRVSRHRPPSLPKRVSPPPAPGPRGLGPLRAEAKALPSCLQRMPPWGHQVLPWKEGSSLETPPCCVPQGLGRAPGWSPADHGGFQNHCPALSQVLGMHSAWGPGLFFFFFACLSASLGLASHHREKPLPLNLRNASSAGPGISIRFPQPLLSLRGALESTFPTPEEACPRGLSPTVCSVSTAEGSAFLFVWSLQIIF